MQTSVQKFATDVRKVMYEDIKNHQGKVFLQSLKEVEAMRQQVIQKTEILLRNKQLITRESIGLNEDDNLPKKLKEMLRIISANEVIGDWDVEQKTFTGKFEAFDNAFDLLQTAIQSNAADAELKKLANELYSTATNKIQENESQYGILKSKVETLWKEFDRFVEPSDIPVQKKAFINRTVLKKVVELVENNADKIKQAKTSCYGSERDKSIMEAKGELTKQLTEMLNIPEGQKNEVLASQKYKHFMNLCYALRNRRVYELETKFWEEKLYSDDAKKERQTKYMVLENASIRT